MTEPESPSPAGAAPPLLQIRELRTWFHGKRETVRAVDDIDLTIEEGETLGLVGESGSGKSVTSLVGDAPAREHREHRNRGDRLVRAAIWFHLPKREMRDLRGKDIGMIFQEPGTSLNPVFRVGDQVGEALRVHLGMSRQGSAPADDRAVRGGRHPGTGTPRGQLSARDVGRTEAARDDRHGPLVQSEAPDRRRTDDRART